MFDRAFEVVRHSGRQPRRTWMRSAHPLMLRLQKPECRIGIPVQRRDAHQANKFQGFRGLDLRTADEIDRWGRGLLEGEPTRWEHLTVIGNGSGAGQKALAATCSMTTESLPPEKSSTGRSKPAATSRKMCTASASRVRR